MQKLKFFLIVLSIITFVSCSDDDPTSPPDDQPTALNAKAGPNQNAEINETVTLDGNQSTGPSGFTYLWSYEGHVPEDQINFQNKNTATPTLVPPSPGLYEFTLTITHVDSSNSDETTVLIGGAIELGGTLTEDLELKNIQRDASKPDYIVKSDLVIPAGITLSIVEDDVKIEFESETGIHIDGGKITNETEDQDDSFLTEFFGENGWKGIWVKNGEININHSLIINAGSTKFSGLEEAAAVTLSGETTQLTSFSDNDFVNSSSYDINVLDKFPQVENSVLRNKLSYRIPIKAVITFVGFWSSAEPNLAPENVEYLHLIPSGKETKDVILKGLAGFSLTHVGGKYLIDGDFWAGSNLSFDRGSTIYIKENSAILADKSLYSYGSENEPITIEGFEGKNWKGIAHRNVHSVTFKYTTFKNSGYGNIEFADFTAKDEAVLYSAFFTGGRLENCIIEGSNGFGYYNELTGLVNEEIMTTTFKDCKKGGIRTNLASVNLCIAENHNNQFELADGIPAVYVSEADLNPEGRFYSLGDGNYYLMDTNWEIKGDFTIEAGVHLKFKSGRYFRRSSSISVTWFEIKGTIDNPVIFDGETGTSGSWGGFLLEGYFRINGLVVKNGGEFILPGATEKANIISNFHLMDYGQQFLTNSKILNSAGWGIVTEADRWNFEFEAPEKNNTFDNNTSGDILIK